MINLTKKIQIWGLTGGIGSGKSIAARFFEEAGISVINLDYLGRAILDSDTSVHKDLRQLFGEEIFLKEKINRQAIREIIFKDSKKRQALEKILHPKIWELFNLKAETKAKEGAKLVLCEAALLIEHNHTKLFPRLIVIMASPEIRRQRVMLRDLMAPELFNDILKSQTSDEIRKSVATHLIWNESNEKELKKSVELLITQWKKDRLI